MTLDYQRLNIEEFAHVRYPSWELWEGQLRASERSASRGWHVHDPKHGNRGSPRPAKRAFLGRQEHGGNIGALSIAPFVMAVPSCSRAIRGKSFIRLRPI